MKAIYERMERDCEIGPYHIVNGQKVLKPFVEYPKVVGKRVVGQRTVGKDAQGNNILKDIVEDVIVKDLEEETAYALNQPVVTLKDDPLREERKALRKAAEAADAARVEMTSEIAKMKAQLAMLQQRDAPKAKVAETVAPFESLEPVRPRKTPSELIAESKVKPTAGV